MLVEAAIPTYALDIMCPELKEIITNYFRHLLKHPVESFGLLESQVRFKFAEAQSKRLTAAGPSVLARPIVAKLFDLGMTDQQVTTSFGGIAIVKLMDLITHGVSAGLYALLGLIEGGIQEIPNSTLAEFSLSEIEAETFRALADEFSGTFEQLIETAKALR